MTILKDKKLRDLEVRVDEMEINLKRLEAFTSIDSIKLNRLINSVCKCQHVDCKDIDDVRLKEVDAARELRYR